MLPSHYSQGPSLPRHREQLLLFPQTSHWTGPVLCSTHGLWCEPFLTFPTMNPWSFLESPGLFCHVLVSGVGLARLLWRVILGNNNLVHLCNRNDRTNVVTLGLTFVPIHRANRMWEKIDTGMGHAPKFNSVLISHTVNYGSFLASLYSFFKQFLLKSYSVSNIDVS